MRSIVLIGGGGHCVSCIDVIESSSEYEIVGILDSGLEKGSSVLGYPVLGGDELIAELAKKYENFLITVGQIKTAEVRKKLYKCVVEGGGRLPVVISNRAHVSRHSSIGAGTIVMHDVVINAGVTVGINNIFNTKCLIEHDVKIGNHCHISTSSVVNGSCTLGDEVFLGSNSVIKNNVVVESKSVLSYGEKHE